MELDMEGIGGEVSTNQPNELPAEPHVQVQTTGTAASTSAALDSLGNESSNPTAPDATAGDDDSAACSANTMPATTDGIIAEGKRTIQQFLRDHTCYNVLKDSGKVVVFDVQIPVKLAFFALVEHDVKSSPLWDSAQQKFVGMITASDFIDILKHFHTNSDGSAGDDLSEHSIASWRASVADRNPESQNLQPLVFVSPEQTVFDACALLHNSRIHRLPIIDAEQNSVLSIVTHQVLLEFLVSNFREQRRLFDQPVQELGIGTYGDDVIVVQESMALIEVLDLLIARCISAVPVVDSSGVVVNVYCRTDVTSLARDRAVAHLDTPVGDVLTQQLAEGVHAAALRTCSCDETLHSVFEMFAEWKVHRLVCTDFDGRCTGVVSLSDLFGYLVEG